MNNKYSRSITQQSQHNNVNTVKITTINILELLHKQSQHNNINTEKISAINILELLHKQSRHNTAEITRTNVLSQKSKMITANTSSKPQLT